jgi:SAM-dependent methyltransferase
MCGSRESAPRRAVRHDGHLFDIVACGDCGFVFVLNPRGETFEPEQAAPAAVPEKARHRQVKRICDRWVLRGVNSAGPRRIVEVGAGWGGLAQVFSRDPRYRYLGLEPSASRAEFCRRRGFDVVEGFFDGPESVHGAVDAIVFDNVLEHVLEPDRMVGAAAAALKPGGALIVIVPNLHDVRQLRRAWRERHHWQPHCHINYFSSDHLERMFARHGLALRYFGLEAFGGRGDDLELLPRVLLDSVGMRLFGLNAYAIRAP